MLHARPCITAFCAVLVFLFFSGPAAQGVLPTSQTMPTKPVSEKVAAKKHDTSPGKSRADTKSPPTTTATRNGEKSDKDSPFKLVDILNTALGAFLGFGSSLYVDRLLRKKRRQKCIENIALELRDIRNLVADKQDCDSFPPALSYAICTPIWETVIGNGDILELKEKPYYDDLFLVYAHISKLSKMEDFARENRDNNVSKMTDIIKQRRVVVELLDDRQDHELSSLLARYART